MIMILCTAPGTCPGANSGELTAAGSTLGIVHPSGYPTWTHLAHAFATYLPFGDQAFRVNLLSALCIWIAMLLVVSLFKSLYHDSSAMLPFAAIAMFHPIVFAEALSAEVYAMHLFLTVSLLCASIQYRRASDEHWALTATFLAGLSLSNHLLAVFNLPLLLHITKSAKPNPRSTATKFVFFLLGLSPYLYLPIRSAQSPLIAWHRPQTLKLLIQHVSGSEFQGQIAMNLPATLATNFRILVESIQPLPGILLVPVSLLGIYLLYRSIPALDRIAMMLFIGGIFLFPLIYHIHDIQSYFLVPIAMLLLLPAYTTHIYPPVRRHLTHWGGRYAAGIILVSGAVSWGEVKLYQVPLLRHYATAILSGTPPGSTVYFQGDNPMNALAIRQVIEHFRDDLTLIDLNGNLEPIHARKKVSVNPGYRVRTFRTPSDYDSYQPNGMVFLPRSTPVYQPDLQTFTQTFLETIPGEKSRWNPSFTELISQIHINLAENEFENGSWDVGVAHLNHAVNVSPSASISRYGASIFAARGEIHSALMILFRQIEADRRDAISRNNAAYYLFLAGGPLDRALELSEQSLRLDPGNTAAILTCYRLLIATGALDKAESLETGSPGGIPGNLIVQRRLLQSISDEIATDIRKYQTPNQVDAALPIMPLPALNHHYRLLLTRKILRMEHQPEDLHRLATHCLAMNLPQSALSVMNQSDSETSDPAVLRNALNRACHNYSRLP